MLNLFEKLYKYISFFLIISQHWEEVGTWNPPWWSYSQNLAANDMAMQEARASATMILT